MPNSVMYGPEYQGEQAEIERRRKLAEALMAKGMQSPQSRQAGRYVVQSHPLEGLANIAQMFAGSRMAQGAQSDQASLGQRVGADRERRLAQALQTAQGGQPMMSPEDMAQNPFPSQSATQPNPMGAYSQLAASGDPTLMQAGGQMLNLQAQQEARQQAQEFAQAQATQAQAAAAERAAADRASREGIAAEGRATRETLAGLTAASRPAPQPVAVIGPDGKPRYVSPEQAVGMQPANQKGGQMPMAAVKEQNELLEQIGLAGGIQQDLAEISGQLSTGELNVGLVSNAVNTARNAVGWSSPGSENFNTFKTTLERLRNDSLRLNKGVQTEGDAQRAWNELMGSINDPAVVQKRLAEIQALNQRAVNLKRLQIETIRNNFNAGELDTANFTNQPPAVLPSRNDRRNTPRSGRTVVVDY